MRCNLQVLRHPSAPPAVGGGGGGGGGGGDIEFVCMCLWLCSGLVAAMILVWHCYFHRSFTSHLKEKEGNITNLSLYYIVIYNLSLNIIFFYIIPKIRKFLTKWLWFCFHKL